ncbi:hypothetical protein R3X26_17215 [Vibrio sp. TH_r3]|uniref:hypothetical protein n=1 Tax=Vibrio sp. TH_r3 TaxID=3082084 RepID=UPI0029538EF3|nr:hypothetical protein [Vibrio sp. TH_r3]MDV7106139.1 hypothetical protein [Vibrio sp. TH_r3]
MALISLNILTVTSSVVHNAVFQLIDKLPMAHLRENSPTVRSNKLNQEIKKLERRNAKLKSNTTKLTKNIAKRTAKSAARNLGSSVVEAVPYVGIAAVIASLSLDIKDACQTMKDIDTIEANFKITNSTTTDETDKVCGYEYSIPTATELSIEVQRSLDKAQKKSSEFSTDISESMHSAYQESVEYGVEIMESWSAYFD